MADERTDLIKRLAPLVLEDRSRAAAEKRGGTMTLHWENEWFTLRVLLPQKS